MLLLLQNKITQSARMESYYSRNYRKEDDVRFPLTYWLNSSTLFLHSKSLTSKRASFVLIQHKCREVLLPLRRREISLNNSDSLNALKREMTRGGFQNPGVCPQAFPFPLPPPPPFVFCSRPIFRATKRKKSRQKNNGNACYAGYSNTR